MKTKKHKNFHLGFPIESSKNPDTQRGVAMMIALFAVSIIMIFATNMIVNTAVQREMSIAKRDRVKAEYMAKSGFNLAVFMVGIDWGIDLLMYSGLVGEKVFPTDTNGDIWATLNHIPIGGDSAELLGQMQEQFDLKAVNDDDVISTLKEFEGNFSIVVEDESSKINLNRCSYGFCSATVNQLRSLLKCPAEAKYLEDKQIDPEEMVQRIKDWIDKDTKTENSGFNNEDDPYGKRQPPDKAKNGPMDTVDELLRIEGWDDEMHAIFSPYLTVYPFVSEKSDDVHRMNLNTVPQALLSCLFPKARDICRHGYFSAIDEREQSNGSLADTNDAVKTFIEKKLCDANSTQKGEANPKNWFSTYSTIYRIKVEGSVDLHTRTLETVVQVRVPNLKNGEKGFYKVLYQSLN